MFQNLNKVILIVSFCMFFFLIPLDALSATPTAVPTFESIGITWDIANGSSSNECLVEYQIDGAGSWNDALDLWYDPDETEYRGSVLLLNPDTTYNIRLTLNDTSDTDTIQITTMSETFPEGTTTYLPLTRNTRYDITTSGTSNAYRVYTFNPSNGSATIDTNRSGSNSGHNMYINANYIIVRGLTLKDALNSGIAIAPGSHDIVIEECDISGFGDGASGPTGFTWDGAIAVGWSSGVYNITIQRNRIHSPGDDCNSWCEPTSGTHPNNNGPYAITMQEAGSRWIIRYNSIYSTNGNFFCDALCNGETSNTNHNMDVYGNYIANYWDDGFQAEGDEKNVRIWGNYFHNYHHAIACATVPDGPVYIFRNVTKPMAVGSWCGYNRGGFLKTSQSSPANNGRKYVFNNTMLWDPTLSEPILGAGGSGGGGIGTGGNGLRRIVSKNNILEVRSGTPSILGSCSTDCSFSNELYNGSISQPVSNGISGTPTYSPTPSYALSDTTTGTGIFTLSISGNGYDDGVAIDNITDGYEGAAPDIGAHEYGTAPMEFGVDAYSGIPDTTPPTLSSATIESSGTTMKLVFSETVVTTGYESGDFDIDCTNAGNNIALSSPSGSGTTWDFTLPTTIYSDDTCNLDFDGETDDVEDTAGNDLLDFSNESVTNNSTQDISSLLYASNLIYQGAFRVPQGTYGTSTLNWGGTALAYNAANNSLFISSHDHDQHIGELSIPTLVDSSNINDLNTATFLQTFKDGLEGQIESVNPTDPNKKIIGGLLVYGGELYISVWSYYDGAGTQDTSHFVRPLNLSTTGQLEGPYTVGTQYPGWVSAYMAAIPAEWQTALGGPALTGGCCHAIVSQQSLGPATSVFDPVDIGVETPVPATQALGYPNSNPNLGAWDCDGTPNPEYNMTTQVDGVVFPAGSSSVLFFGTTGLGECYYQAGVNAPPYSAYAWAYDVNDLIAVKNGEVNQYDIYPYDSWEVGFYFGGTRISGAAYDPGNNLIYVIEFCTDGECYPVIHAYLVDTGTQVFKATFQ